MPGDKVKLCMKQFAVLSRPGADGEEGADQPGPLAGPLPHASRPSRTSAAPGPAALLTSAGPQLERGPCTASQLPDRGDSKVNREAPALPGPPLGVGGEMPNALPARLLTQRSTSPLEQPSWGAGSKERTR